MCVESKRSNKLYVSSICESITTLDYKNPGYYDLLYRIKNLFIRKNGADDFNCCDPSTNSPRPNDIIFKLFISLHLLNRMCLKSPRKKLLYYNSSSNNRRKNFSICHVLIIALIWCQAVVGAYPNEFEKNDKKLLDKINLEQSIAAVFNKVAYGSTTKRSIPDNSYPVTTLATPLLTTYRYSDGNNEYRSVDYTEEEEGRSNAELEKDHALPTSAPAADILKNNNNRHYNNPNRYNNDRLRPDFDKNLNEHVTENTYKTTTGFNIVRNVRPTKSIYSKDVPSYIPPNRAFFTPPLPPEFLNPFADKPTLRGTNNDGFINHRPIPPPSLMPNKDRIPFRPDFPPNKVNLERNETYHHHDSVTERKKTLNTPSHNVNVDRLGGVYGINRVNETNFEYDKSYIPSITRILSGSNGRHDEIPDLLFRSVTATPHVRKPSPETTKTPPVIENTNPKIDGQDSAIEEVHKRNELDLDKPPEGVTSRKEKERTDETTTQASDAVNLPNVKEKTETSNVTKASSDEIWLICWNVHIYLVVLFYIVLAVFSIYKLIRYENDPHMFSKSYFLTVHLMLTVICVLRIFYLTYDPYNVSNSFNIFLYEFLHNFPLSLLACTFAVLILFLLKRTLNHLQVKTRPIFLVVFAVIHICLCFCLSIVETLGHFDRGSLIVCKPVFVLLSWALGFSYLYLYKIIKNVLAKKTQNLSEMCTQNISYASHITIAVALLFVLLGFIQLYALFFIKIDRFNEEIKHHWILWGFELSVRVLEISIVALLAIVVSLRMSQREKQTVGFPLFPCTTSDSSTDNIFPNNCTTNPNALNYSRNEMILDNIPTETVERPNLLKSNQATLERFERPRFDSAQNSQRSSLRKNYDTAKYYVKPKYDFEYNNEDYQQDVNVYSEPVVDNVYERTRHEFEHNEFERSDFDRRSKNSSNTSGRRARKHHARPHLGVQTLPAHQIPDTMLVDDQGFVRFRHLQDVEHEKPKKLKKQLNDVSHYSDA